MRLQKLIVQNIFWRGLYFLSVLVLNIVISRYLKAETSGRMYYVINNLSLLLLVTGISLESGATYYASKNEMNASGIAGFCFLWALSASIISYLFLLLFPNLIAGGTAFNQEYFFACTAYVLGFLLINYFSALFFARQDFFIPNLILLAANLAMILLIILFGNSYFLGKNFVPIYFFSFLAQGIIISAFYFLKGRKYKVFLSFADFKNISGYSLIALFANVIFFLVYRIDYWFVKIYCSEHDLGNYIQVSKLGQIFLVIPTMIAAIIFPKTASSMQTTNMQNALQTLSRLLFISYFSIIVIMLLFGSWLFSFLYGSSFDEMYKPFIFLSPGILSLSIQALLAAYFAGKNMLAVNIKGSLIALAVIVLGDVPLIPSFGINAAAAVSSAGYICYMFYSLLIFKNESGADSLDFFRVKHSDFSYLKNIFKK